MNIIEVLQDAIENDRAGQVYSSGDIKVIYNGQVLYWYGTVKAFPVIVGKDLIHLDFKPEGDVSPTDEVKHSRPLGDDKAWDIFRRYIFNREPSKDIADDYGITQRSVQRIGKMQMYRMPIKRKLSDYLCSHAGV